MNVFRMIPGVSDKSTQGNPGVSFIAERRRGNPWPLLVEEQDYPDGVSSVTALAGGGSVMSKIMAAATEHVLNSIADAMALRLYYARPIRRRHGARTRTRGRRCRRSRSDVKEYLFQQAYRTVDGLKSVGKYWQREYDKQHANGGTHRLVEDGKLHRGLTPDDILLVVGGGDAGGIPLHPIMAVPAAADAVKPIGVCIDCD